MSTLRNRFGKLPQPENGQNTEELLIEKLDIFLSSIEHRLEKFEQYFRLTGTEEIEFEDVSTEKDGSQSRRNSTASLSSIKSFSLMNLTKVHQQLNMVKDQVLKTSLTNLEFLYKTLDDQYKNLFTSEDIPTESEPISSNKEVLLTKIITTILYFEEKLNHIDTLIKSKTPQATANYDKDDKFNRFRFFNFNKALKDAEHKYLHYYQLPLSWRENRYIINGYRFTMSHKDMMKSMFHFDHNETANIWSHMIGAFVMIYIGLVHFPLTEVYAQNSFSDNAVMYVFLFAALKCLMSSIMWHTYSCFAKITIRNRFACVDYTGITVLITCSVISAEYCALYPYPKLLLLFVGFSVLCGAGGLIFNWSPHFDKPECRPFRIGFFVGLALLGSTTIIFKWYYEGMINSLMFYSPLLYKSFVFYGTGVIFYGGLIPERWRYDVIINEDDTCKHNRSAADVLGGHIDNDGEQEMEEIESELAAKIEDPDEATYQDIMARHFPLEPTQTPYHNDFMSLWWVDYIFSSHNIWHVFVVLGVIGHYYCILGMFESIVRI